VNNKKRRGGGGCFGKTESLYTCKKKRGEKEEAKKREALGKIAQYN